MLHAAPNVFEIIIEGESVDSYLYAQSAEEMEEWLVAIKNVRAID